jgi:LL-diaminopimelate aminotransferase
MVNYKIAKRLINDDNFDLGSLNKFSRISNLKKELLKSEDADILDFGIGESDDMASYLIIRKLTYEAKKWENRVYADNGIEEFKIEAANYLNRTYKLNLTKDNINHCIGAKSALAILPYLFINKGDYLLTTTPGYAVMSNVTRWLGGKVYEMKLTKENNFLPDLTKIPKSVLKKAKMMYINYPNNPTGAVADIDFYNNVVNFAKKNQIFVVSDAAYLPLVFNKSDQVSFLNAKGALDVGIEVHTLSKGFNMTGWRIGFVAGNKEIVSLFAKVKDVVDSGQFIPIQKAAITALKNDNIVEENNQKYYRRHILVAKALTSVGLITKIPKGTFYQYVRIPTHNIRGDIFENAMDFSMYLLKKHQILVIPWDDAGGYVRFSMTFIAKNKEEEEQVANKLYFRLKDEGFDYLD